MLLLGGRIRLRDQEGVKAVSIIPQNMLGSWVSAVHDDRACTEGYGRARVDKDFWYVKSGGRRGRICVFKGRARSLSLSLSLFYSSLVF